MNIKEKALIATLKLLGKLSLRNNYRLSCGIHFILKSFPLRLKKTIHTNLSRCLPNLSFEVLAQFEQKVFFHTILRMVEMPFFWFGPSQDSLIREISGEAAFQADFQKGLGMIVLVPHLGAWEVVNFYMGKRYPSVSLYKPIKKAHQEELVRLARERYGTEMFPTTISGVKSLFAALKSGKCAGILPDHDPGENGGIMAPFFGIPANTTTLIAKLAQKSGAPIYFMLAERLPKGSGFHLHFVKANETLKSKNLEEAATAMNQGIADLVAQFPEQYEWSYKRFRRTAWKGQNFY
jgi:KDO2-lipid IV(A) lauroyltransferase